MPYTRNRSSSWSARRRYKRYFKRYFRRYSRKYINGSSKSTVRVKVPMQGTWTGTITVSGQAPNYTVTPPNPSFIVSPWYRSSTNPMSALNSVLYRTYTTLYEEVKCIGMKVRIASATPIGTATLPNLYIVTTWDRRNSPNEPIPSFQDLQIYSTQQSAIAVNNSVAKLKRSCYASDLLEKAQWHDTTLEQTATYWRDYAYEGSGANVNFFAPALACNFTAQGLTQSVSVTFTFDITYYFAFRNPKYGANPGSNKNTLMVGDAIPDTIPDTEKEELDDEEGIMDEDEAADFLDTLRDEDTKHEAAVPPTKKTRKASVVRPPQKNSLARGEEKDQ